jgi:hypothetical protein
MRGVAERFSAADLEVVAAFLEQISAAIDPDD